MTVSDVIYVPCLNKVWETPLYSDQRPHKQMSDHFLGVCLEHSVWFTMSPGLLHTVFRLDIFSVLDNNTVKLLVST